MGKDRIDKILVDGTAVNVRGGPAIYLKTLLNHLPQDKVDVCVPKGVEIDYKGNVLFTSSNRIVAEEIDLPKYAKRYKALFSPKSKLPFVLSVPSVVMVHDVIPIVKPHTEKLLNVLYWNYHIKHAYKNGTVVITGSYTAKRELINVLGKRDVKVIYHGIDWYDSSDSRIIEQFNLEKNSYILYVGTIQPRKNVPILIESVRKLRRRGNKVKLCIAGRYGWKEKVEEEDWIVFTGFVSRKELASLYKNALMFAYLSSDEGFGLPPVEAGGYGLPLVLSDIPIFRELHGKYGLFTKIDVDSVVEVFEKNLDKGYSKEEESFYRKFFSAERMADETFGILERFL